MKLFFILLFFSFTAYGEVVSLGLKDVTEKVSKTNYTILSQAERLYQAKKKISLMRASLLPKLNIWKLLSIPAALMNPWMGSYLKLGASLVGDIAPFLVPKNWFNLRQSVWSYRAQKEQYRALWGNELMTARLLFITVLKDQELLELIKEKIETYKLAVDIARTRQVFGVDDPSVLDFILSKYLAIQEDQRVMETLVLNETKELIYLLGMDARVTLSLTAVKLPNVSRTSPLDPEMVAFKALATSPEKEQFFHLLASLKNAKKSIYFTILGVTNVSAGTGDGTYDNVPVSNGLGFGTGPSFKISKSKERLISLQLKATEETLKRQSEVLVDEYNSLIKGFKHIEEMKLRANQAYETLLASISMGRSYTPQRILEVINNSFANTFSHLAQLYQFRLLIDKIQRLTFAADYNMPSGYIDDILSSDKPEAPNDN